MKMNQKLFLRKILRPIMSPPHPKYNSKLRPCLQNRYHITDSSQAVKQADFQEVKVAWKNDDDDKDEDDGNDDDDGSSTDSERLNSRKEIRPIFLKEFS